MAKEYWKWYKTIVFISLLFAIYMFLKKDDSEISALQANQSRLFGQMDEFHEESNFRMIVMSKEADIQITY